MTIDDAERFERLLAALEEELVAASDEEIFAAASDLGMNPTMKGSAAFFGVTIDLRALSRPSDSSESWDAAGTRRGLKDDSPGS